MTNVGTWKLKRGHILSCVHAGEHGCQTWTRCGMETTRRLYRLRFGIRGVEPSPDARPEPQKGKRFHADGPLDHDCLVARA